MKEFYELISEAIAKAEGNKQSFFVLLFREAPRYGLIGEVQNITAFGVILKVELRDARSFLEAQGN